MRRALLVALLAQVAVACGGTPESRGPSQEPGKAGPSVAALPAEGVAVEVARRLKPQLFLVGLDGRVYARPELALDSAAQLYRNVLVLRKPGTGRRYVVARDGTLVRYRSNESYPPLVQTAKRGKCGVFARRAGRVYQLCGASAPDFTTIALVNRGMRRSIAGSPPHARPPPLHIGAWRDAYLSPDGKTVLATWSVECEVPTAFFADVGRRNLRAVTGDRDWRKAPESIGLGWTSRGLAVVELLEGDCGTAFEKPGVYVIDPRTGEHRLVYAVRGAFAVMWRR